MERLPLIWVLQNQLTFLKALLFKHLLRHQPANAQIGLMEGNTFCTTLQPRLFTMDLNVMEHKVFYTELLNLCEADDAALMKLACYKSLPSLVPLRIAALNALAACNYLPQSREKIIAALFKALNSTNGELQEAGEACMRKFLEGATIEVDQIHTHMRPLLMMLGDYRSLTLNVVNRLTSVTRLFPNSFNDKFCDQMMQHLRKWMEVVVITHKGGQRSDGSEMKICSAIINLFHLIPAAPQTLVKPLLEVVMKTERAMLIEAGSPFREPLIRFLTRHPSQTVELFMMEATLNDPQWSRMFMSFLKHKDAKPLRDVLASNPGRFVPLLVPPGPAATVRPSSPSTSTARLDLQFQAIKIISIIVKHDEGWLAGQHSLVSQLRRVWVSDAFQERHHKDNMSATNWKEPKLLAYCLLSYCKRNYSEIELLFQLLRAFTGRFLCNMTFLKDYMEEEIPKNYSIAHKRALFFRFVEFNDPHFGDELKAKVLQHVLNPAFLYSFEKGEGEQLLGPPNPEGDNPESITSVFITKVLDPEKQADLLDSLRIYLLQFATLLVEHAPHHIHDNNKSRNSKLRRLMTFAWPCLLSKACVDPACKYSGHLLLAHIIAKFAIHKKIVLQVFHSLLKAHTMEARVVVRQAMAILTPAVPARMEDGHQMLTHWTRKIIVEEGHTVPQLVHILHLIVQHFRVYYPVRHHLVQHMISAMQRLGFTPSVTIEQRKLAVDLAEVVIKWELQRIKDQQSDLDGESGSSGEGTSTPSGAVKRGLSLDSSQDLKRFRTATGAAVFGRSQSTTGAEALLTKPLEKQHTDTVVSFLIRIACQVNDSTGAPGSPGELLSRRCVSLMKTALRPDMWPRAELKLQWFDKLLMSVEQPTQANFANICTGLEILHFLLTVLQSPAILAHFKPLQRGIAACMTCGNTKVLRAVHNLLSRLMSIFPTEPSSSTVASKYEELECLYAAVGKVIYEGLTNYEKATNANPTQLFGTLMILKSACSYNPSYIDRLISVFMRSLQKMVREHLNPQTNAGTTETNTVTSELVILSLDLVKTRLSVMSLEMRKNFIQVILTSLIEKSTDAKILRAIVKIVEEWVKNTSSMANQVPNPREKSILLVKMMTYIEKRFSEDLELNAQFLDLVNYVYRDENLSGSDITSKLEPAFLSGLRCAQPLIRAKFFDVFDNSMKRRVYERLLYICCSQNWEAMGNHFWIKQCIELLLAVCEHNGTIGTSCQGAMLPSITNVINLADSHDRAAFAMATHIKQEPRERENNETKEEDVEIDIELAPGDQSSTPKTKEQAERDAGNQLHMLTNRHDKFLDSLREVKTGALLNALVQLCHISTPLAEKTWVQLFPRLWKILSDRQQHALAGEISPFLCSGSHQAQRDCQPSALSCFVEALSQCVPPIPIRPCVLKYLGKTHNLWFRSTLLLEQQAFEKGLSLHLKPRQSSEFYEQESITPPQQEILDSLAELYSLLQEEDMWAGLWQKRCKFPETSTAIAFEQHGFFEQAQETYEKAMEKARKEHERNNAPPAVLPEYQLWEDHWIRCSKELNQWEALTEYGQSKGHSNPFLVLECAWRVSNWAAMKEAMVQVELSCPKEMAWKVNMHRGYLAICHPEEQQLNFIERLVEMASSLAIREWRRLPHIVSHVHTPLLQAAQQIIELQEAAQINAGLQPASLGRNTSLHDMKTVVKTWRNRLPIVSDDLSHWSSIFMWRQHHYQAIVTAYESSTQHDPSSNNAMLGVHASASAIIQYGKIARKQGLVNVALDILSRIHTIPTVPIVDCFQKIRQQVKCYLQLAGIMGKNECMQGLEVIESTNLKYFTKEMTAEFYALKGMFLAQVNKSEEANKAFSAAVQMHDVLVKAWAMWGDYLENIFAKDRQLHLGVSAITCYLHACRHQNESKSRKYLAKVLWLLSFDDKNTLADAVEKYCIGVPPIQWLAWIPQLLTCLVGSEGKPLLNLISQVGRMYPQAVYFPIRTLYLTLKIEQRERYKSDSGQQQPTSVGAPPHSASDPGPIRATAPMWRCSRIMHMQRELHPTLLSSLEGIVDQMVWFRENWHEEVLRQLQQGLAKCYSVAFEKSGAVSDAKITPHTLNFVKKLVSTFGVGLENVSNVSTMFSSAASESLARRAQATAQDPVFQKMKGQFTTDFDFSVPGSMKLHNLISKLKKWIKILEAKTKQLPKFFLIEEKCRFLSNFSAQTAEVEIPGEFLMPKPTHYYIRIARFMPRVEIVQKHNTAARRLYIRGHNGKMYPYLVMNDACLTESRREERVLQLLRLLNPCLEKRKETTKRHLFFSVPRVVAVSPQMRLVEDNPSSLSLVEIYKQRCAKKGIEHDNPVSRYYDRLATVQARGTQASHQVLRDILKEVQGNMVPRSMLREWTLHMFPNATDYWTFRKMFTIQLALIGLAEFVLHLNRLNPEMLQIAQDTGKLNVAYFRFDINDATGDLDANRPVPFRLTPNISEFLTPIGVCGPLTASMIAVARCFAQPSFKVDGILRAVLRDEIIAWHKKTQEDTSMPLSPAGQPENMDSQQLVSLVQKAVSAIMSRLHNLAQFEGGESKVNTLVAAANSLDNLCRMDPAWHPWL
uniref:Transformation/transcription domain-associated protein n=1 Tax=Scleropages formosus TaxID=113540 RepID=A0A8C9SK39_SCLFO